MGNNLHEQLALSTLDQQKVATFLTYGKKYGIFATYDTQGVSHYKDVAALGILAYMIEKSSPAVYEPILNASMEKGVCDAHKLSNIFSLFYEQQLEQDCNKGLISESDYEDEKKRLDVLDHSVGVYGPASDLLPQWYVNVKSSLGHKDSLLWTEPFHDKLEEYVNQGKEKIVTALQQPGKHNYVLKNKDLFASIQPCMELLHKEDRALQIIVLRYLTEISNIKDSITPISAALSAGQKTGDYFSFLKLLYTGGLEYAEHSTNASAREKQGDTLKELIELITSMHDGGSKISLNTLVAPNPYLSPEGVSEYCLYLEKNPEITVG